MSRLSVYLGRLIGLFLLVISIALFLDKASMVDIVTALLDDRALLLLLGMLALTAGLAIVLAHNVWRGGVLPIVVTGFGWLILIRGLVLLLVPSEFLVAYFQQIRFEDFYYLYAGLTFVIGILLSYVAFTARASDGR